MTFNEVLEKYGKSISDVSSDFDIPVRTLYSWKSGQRVPPAYIISIIDKIYYKEGVISNGEEIQE